MCYIELGTLIPESGGEFIYLYRGYGSIHKRLGEIFAFLYSWSALVILKPSSLAVNSLSCSTYILKPIIGKCGPSTVIIKLGAVVILCN